MEKLYLYLGIGILASLVVIGAGLFYIGNNWLEIQAMANTVLRPDR